MYPLKITIDGRPYSKKNSRESRKARNKKTGKLYSYMVPGEKYEVFETAALYQLKRIAHRFTGPVVIDYVFYKIGNSLQDVDNAICSVNDVLQKSLIIENDRDIYIGSFEIVPGSTEWKTEIFIQQMTPENKFYVEHRTLVGWFEVVYIDFVFKKLGIRRSDEPVRNVDFSDVNFYFGRTRRHFLGLKGGDIA